MSKIILSSRESVWGGGEVFLAQLGQELLAMGHEVTYSVPAGSELARRGPVQRRRQKRAHLVVANDFRSLWKSIFLRPGINRVFVVHGQWQLSKLRVQIAELLGAEFYCVNRDLMNLAYSLGATSVNYLPLGPRPREDSTNRFPRDLPLETKSLVLGLVARLDPIKRFDLFSRTVEAIGARGVVVCPAPKSAAEAEMLSHLSENARITVHSDGNPEWVWQSANLYLLTSRDESLGLSLLESLQRGIPVFTTATQGPKDILQDRLAFGLLSSAEMETDPRSILISIERVREDLDGYWSDAELVISERGPRRCAELILGVLS